MEELLEAILAYFDEDSLFDEQQFTNSLLRLIILLLLEYLKNYQPILFEFLQRNKKIRKEFAEKLVENAKKIVAEMPASQDLESDETKTQIYGKSAGLILEYSNMAEKFNELEKECGFSFGNGETDWEENDISEIIRTAKKVKNEKSIKDFAYMIGRHAKSKHDSFKYEERDTYRGRIGELRLSDDIGAAVPSEIALLKNPLTKKLFMAKFAQKQLLSFRYKNTIATPVSKGKGPVIICLDTSGSMQGFPEEVSKMLTFAISIIAFKERRNVYVISFSCGIKTIELLWNKKTDGINELAKFLRGSFHSGTDVAPALEHAIDLLQSNEWENADILTISDFCIGDMDWKMQEQMKKQQEKGTRFFSLLIGRVGNDNAIKCFDENYKCTTRNSKTKIEKYDAPE